MVLYFGSGAPVSASQGLLQGETDGWAMDATVVGGSVSLKDTTTPANNLDNVAFANSNMVEGSTSVKLVYWNTPPYLRWSPHNYFLNSEAPATQSVTLVVDRQYTFGINGPGSLVGSNGAFGTATDGNPATFTATTTTGTFTLTGSPARMQLTRGNILAPYIKSTGGIKYGIAQSYHIPTGKFAVLAESGTTNMRIRSMEFDDGSWAKLGGTIIPNAMTAPDGTQTADLFLSDTSSNERKLSPGTSVTGTNGTTYIASVFVKAAGYNLAGIAMTDGTSQFGANFNLSTGLWTDTPASCTTPLAKGIYPVGGGWYRIFITFTATNTTLGFFIKYYDNSFDANQWVSWTGNGVSGMYIWGAQLEPHPGTTGGITTDQSTPTSFIPTYGSTVSRSQSSISATLGLPWKGGTDLTVYTDFWRMFMSDNGQVWELSTPTAGDINREGLAYQNGWQDGGVSGPQFNVDSTSAHRCQNTYARHTPGDYAKNDSGQAVSNTASTGTSNTTMSNFNWYYNVNGGGGNYYYYRQVFVPRRVSNVDMINWKYSNS